MTEFTIECGTCLASGTTACTDCVVGHLVANDDGPIDYVAVPFGPARAVERAIDLFRQAGLVDDPVRLVSVDEFERGEVAAPALT